MKTEHTPLPWQIEEMGNGRKYNNLYISRVCNLHGKATEELTKANAAFIVRACNSHYELVEALEAVFESVSTGKATLESNGQLLKVKQALAKAKQE